MAESLGVAASVAGLLGLCGQIVQGCLFLKDFIEGARDAPEDIRLLLTEVQILSAAIGETKDAIEQLNDLGLELKVDTYKAALKQCHELLSTVVIRVTTNSSNLKRPGRLKWWYQLNVSTQRKTLDAMMRRLERAKTQVQMVQSNICLALHRNHYLLLSSISGEQAASRSTVSAALIFDKISDFEGAVATLTNSVFPTASQSLEKIGHIEAHLRCLENLSGGCRTNPISNSLAQTTPEWSTMHHVIHDAVETALKDHFYGVDGQVCDTDSAAHSEKHVVLFDEPHHEIRENLGSKSERPSNRLKNHLLPRSRMATKFTYRNSFFDVEVETNSSPENQDPDVSIAANEGDQGLHLTSPESKSTTALHIRLRLPLWHKGLVIDASSSPYPYESRIGLSLTTYNIRSDESEIFKAARELDLTAVRGLLRTGSASPWDRNIHGTSPLDTVLYWLLTFAYQDSQEISQNVARAKIGLELMELLKTNHPAEHCSSTHFLDIAHTAGKIEQYSSRYQELCGRSLQIYLQKSITALAESYLYQYISKQQVWPIDFDNRDHPSYPHTHVENDRQMLLDPHGLRMEADIRNGRRYLAYSDEPWEQLEMDQWSSIFSLMRLYSKSFNKDVRSCCVNRLTHIYSQGVDPRTVEEPCYKTFGRHVNHVDVALEFGMGSILKCVLQDVGWSTPSVEELFDERIYRRLPELFDGQITFHGQDECCAMFLRNISYYGLKDLGIYPQIDPGVIFELSRNTGMSFYHMDSIVRQCLSSLQSKKMPGSWPAARALLLVPGIDFPLYEVSKWSKRRFFDMVEWPCVQEILAEEGYKLEVLYVHGPFPSWADGYRIWRRDECLYDSR